MRDISYHIRRLLYILASIFLLFGARVYYLSIIQHEYHVNEAKRPALRAKIKTPNRGTIRDRFNHPLAINTISYTISVLYDPIKSLPRRKFVIKGGKKVLTYPRKDAIENLARFLEHYCEKDAQEIEDLVYSKASLFPNTPFTLKEEVSEDVFFRLKMKESFYPGLNMKITKKRTYPLGKVASHILGYMGAIDEREHLRIKSSIKALKAYLEDKKNGLITPLPKGFSSTKQVQEELKTLLNKSYTIHSSIGKSGIEKQFDSELKGSIGKDLYLVDHKGSRRCLLPESYEETPGRRVLLTISAKLQDHCEKLLADSEKLRMDAFHRAGKNHHKLNAPWISGGSIVAMIPSTGEVVALASYPTFDPNDFSLANKDKALKWLETPAYIGKIFDGKYPLEKDVYNITTQNMNHLTKELTYDNYLDTILSKDSAVKIALNKIEHIHGANFIQNCMEMLLSLSEETDIHPLIDALYSGSSHSLTFHRTKKDKREEIISCIKGKTSLLKELRKEIDPYLSLIPKNDDKILFLDILRLFCPNHLFDDSLLAQTGHESLKIYKEFSNAKICVEQEVYEVVKKIFHEQEFAEWRETYFTDYLKSKRVIEKNNKRHAKPYISYLEEIERSLFQQFFTKNKWEFIEAYLTIGAPVKEGDIRLPYFQALIEKSLKGTNSSYQKLKNHLAKLSDDQIIPYLKTMRSYNELNRELYGKYYFPHKSGRKPLEKDLARAFYPGNGFGFSKSSAFAENTPLGSSFKIFVGYEALRDHYNSRPGLTFPLNPMTITDTSPSYSAKITRDTILGYHSNHKPIRRIYKGGRLPRGHRNVGKVNFLEAMEKSSNLYYSLLASDVISDPSSLLKTAKDLGFGSKTGIELPYESRGAVPDDILLNRTSLYSFAIGQHTLSVTPLQTAVALSSLANNGEVLKPQIVKAIANIEPTKDPASLLHKKKINYQKQYKNIGIYFPLFPEGEETDGAPYLKKCTKKVVKKLDIPDPVHKTLMQSLYNVVNSSKGTARYSAIGSLTNNPYKRSIYKKVMKAMGGKTSTAEIAYNPTLDREQSAIITKDIWFTAISFPDKNIFSSPDLVVVVQLRYGSHGKEAAPLAASVIHEWHKILEEEEAAQKARCAAPR
ncbi:MAG: Peptidoglycan D,D-transpeptidase MrdA [Chlamydiia bacterium]|nr:Peptidoglycan D,D-transpeptidase MrdA [Chlamydiia bacterium]